ncbi:Uncharacterized [Moorella glycerini]|uniref:Uncharacterized protein n=1 Tax=Neomoorella stamsii TaxID=1266720 RepID=A0A9X7J570_9FIRM|nr:MULTISPECIES: hypothetical protein [Moorella]PRR74580.1 hypothetical protein MOST_10150 [Moorella stamsii]CEP69133.1 Uncharacterized [Moorella glycerini]
MSQVPTAPSTPPEAQGGKMVQELKVMEVSEALLPEVYSNKKLHVLEKPRPLVFTSEGRLYPVFGVTKEDF